MVQRVVIDRNEGVTQNYICKKFLYEMQHLLHASSSFIVFIC